MDAEQIDRTQGFAALGLRLELLRAIAALGYEEPTPIQRETIPVMLAGRDVLGQAATGTGKTASFALPVLDAIDPDDAPVPVCLVLTPTRELAVQVSEAMHRYGSEQRVHIVPVYGGQPIGRQFAALDRGAHIVVGTPGRVLDHLRRGSLQLDAVRTVVLDEADEMLDMGFAEDIEEILDGTPTDRQTVLFSATMPKRIRAIAKRHQRHPEHIVIGASATEAGTVADIEQRVYFVDRGHKALALGRILDIEAPRAALVFCKTRNEVDELTRTMNGRGYRAESLHGGMDQNSRDRVVARVREGTAELLIATDVAARGLDIERLTHVVNYDVPSAPESYVHRIGRVGRAGREGTAVTLAEPRQRRLLHNIERLTKQTITVGSVPTVADLRARQIEATAAAIREALVADDVHDYAVVLDALLANDGHGAGDSHEGYGDGDPAGRVRVDDTRLLALAAIKLVHEGRGAVVDEEEIPPSAELARRHDNKQRKDRPGGRDRPDKGRGRSNGHGVGPDGGDRSLPAGGQGGRRGADGETAFLYVGAGRQAKVRPGDLVGAIANESGLTGRDIGPIRITEKFSVVGVPAAAVDGVIDAMASASLRGKRVKVRRYTD
ncbi:MAG: DEAD/DEAH box helicase [Acidimicrobiales bacterium]